MGFEIQDDNTEAGTGTNLLNMSFEDRYGVITGDDAAELLRLIETGKLDEDDEFLARNKLSGHEL